MLSNSTSALRDFEEKRKVHKPNTDMADLGAFIYVFIYIFIACVFILLYIVYACLTR